MKKIFLSTILSLAAATVFASTQTKPTQDKPWRVYMLGGTMNTSDNNHSIENRYYYPNYPQPTLLTTSDSKTTSKKNVDWINGLGGSGSGTVLNNSIFEDFYTGYTPAYTNYDNSSENDSINLDGSGVGNEYQAIHRWGSDWWWWGWNWENFPYNSSSSLNLGVTISSYVANEHCDVTDSAHPPFWTYSYYTSNLGLVLRQITQTETYQRTAQAVWHVQTGGKAIPGRQNLWQFSGSAWEMLSKRGGSSREITNKTQIAIGSLGNLKADGTLWFTLPDEVDKDITPMVAGKDFYTFSVGGQKYPLTILANGNDLSVTSPEFCVGQNVTFSLEGLPDFMDAVGHWNLPGKFVNEAYPYSGSCTSYRVNSALLDITGNGTPGTSCWYVNQPGGTVGVNANLHFSNGQYVSVVAKGDFTVYRPKIWLEPLTAEEQNHYYTVTTNVVGLTSKLKLGENNETGNGTMRFTIDINSKYGGVIGLTQIITANYSNPLYIFSVERCDGAEFYDGPWTVTARTDSSAKSGLTGMNDGPSDTWVDPNIVNLSARDFVRFQPSGGIYVTLGITTWDTVGIAHDAFGVWSITTDATTGPNGPDSSDEFPVWTQNQGGMH
jgi:hypothetical protein